MTIKIIVPLLMFCMSLVGCTSGSKHDTGRKAVIEQAQSIAQTMNAAQNSQNVSTWSNQEDASLVDESQEGSKTTRHQQGIASTHVVVHFGFDGVQISQRDQQQLQPIAAYLMRHEHAQLRIEGNTDERGSREYNIALGERRAQGVSELLQQMGVLKNQMVLVSYGEEKPVDFDHTEAAYQKNRRADMRFIHT